MNLCRDWDASSHPYICFSPDALCDESNRAWQGCPTVAVTKGGRLFAGWYTGGAFEPCIDNYNVLVQSDNGGETWSKPILTVSSDRANRMRNIDIELWMAPDNVLWVMWTLSPYYETSKPVSIRDGGGWDYHREFPYTVVMMCKDPDADDLVWEEPRILCEGFMRCKPIVTSTGRIIAPAYDYSGPDYKLRLSDDGGVTFRNVSVPGKPDVCVYDETTLFEKSDGTLRFLARTNRGFYVFSESSDNGQTWTDAQEYEPAPSTRCFVGRLRNGMIAYIRNVSDTARTGMQISLSSDNGETFPHTLILDDRTNVSYPDLDEDKDGVLYIVYDRERDNRIGLNRETWTSTSAKEIILCRLTAEDIITGQLSESSFIRRTLSRGGKHFVEI